MPCNLIAQLFGYGPVVLKIDFTVCPVVLTSSYCRIGIVHIFWITLPFIRSGINLE